MRRIILSIENETLIEGLWLTAVVRELDLAGLEVDVRTHFPELWTNNPHLTPLSADGERVEEIVLTSELSSDACVRIVGEKLGVALTISPGHADIHVSREETSWASQVEEIVGDERPFWILEPDHDWDMESLQKLVDSFRHRILFAEASVAPRTGAPLEGAIDLRGRTSLRNFIRLVYNAQGIVCPAGFSEHLSAAVKAHDAPRPQRPCLTFQSAADACELIAAIEVRLNEIAAAVDARTVLQRAGDEARRLRESFSLEQFISFASFNNRYAGQTCYIVGRGPTTFDYAQLRDVREPVFFLNDAVSLEAHVSGESFFFAHDACQQVWMTRGLKSTAVLPIGGKFWADLRHAPFRHDGKLVLYQWRDVPGPTLLDMTRGELATREQLFTHTGTMHSLLHFVWFCGFRKIVFIGCDGINNPRQLAALGAIRGYDARLRNESDTEPWWQYSEIRAMQDKLCQRFGFEVEYIGTPASPRPVSTPPKISALAHFTWLGGPMPQMMRDNIDRFRALHTDWEVRVWIGVPHGMPEDLVRAIYSTHELCMRADIIRLWLLHEHGGVYLDGDVYALRSFNELRCHENFAGFRLHGTLNNAVIASAPRSAGIRRLLDEVRLSFARCPSGRKRTSYGPDLLARVHARAPGLLNILPAHYFYIFQTHGTAIRFINAPPEQQREMIDVVRDRVSDGVEPFAIHTWGIPKESMPPGYAQQSSWMKANAMGDALLRRVPNAPLHGAEIGAPDGRLSAYWLGHNASLKLWTAPRNGEADAIRQLTAFACDRISILSDEKAWSEIPDASLDWFFMHENFDDGRLKQLVETKLKRGGLIAFGGETFSFSINDGCETHPRVISSLL